ncbi:MAG: hypothetical protein NW208_18440 [Bryobacter sp.]|nr:hypothetical protein [Bryobacter sp.]
MADRLYLSLWLNGFSPLTMHKHFAQCLTKFPFSSQSPGVYLRVGAVDSSEPALQEQVFDLSQGFDPLIETMGRWQSTDASFEVEGFWDLWQELPEGWRLSPARVNLFFYGPNFPSEWGEQIRIELGVEALFLPTFAMAGRELGLMQSNIRSLLRLRRDLEQTLSLSKINLWSESGENFADRLRQSMEIPSQQ